MTVRWEKLPTEAKPAKKRAGVRRGSWRCSGVQGCGETLVDVTFAFAQRHADTHGGARLECVASTDGDTDG